MTSPDEAPLVFALLGSPVGRSLSPAMHEAAFRALGLPHRYLAIDVPAEGGFRREIERLRRGDLAGSNVTTPHKHLALALADELDASAREVGAANVLVRLEGGRLRAHNTDAAALAAEIEALAPARRGAALVLGAGGGAAAAVVALRLAGFGEIVVTARRGDRARATVAASGGRVAPWSAYAGPRLDAVVQATTAGMDGAGSEALLASVPWQACAPDAIAVDLVYRPARTAFVEEAARRGLRSIGGLGMLVGQAEASFTLWLGREPPRGVMRRAAWGGANEPAPR